jgi:predicted kinase
MPLMKILIGLPGSGKSTYADTLVSQGWHRVNYDFLRHESGMFPDGYKFSKQNEELVKQIADRQAIAALIDGRNVVIDNTNLSEHSVEHWTAIANPFSVVPSIVRFDTPIDECLKRNDQRTGWAKVPRAVIERMALFNNLITFPSDKKIVIVDMDGTLSDSSVRQKYVKAERCWYCSGKGFIRNNSSCVYCNGAGKQKKEWNKFFEEVDNDKPNRAVAEWVRYLSDSHYICVVSGRPIDKCGVKTDEWLKRHNIPFNRLFMRAAGDSRKDIIIKKEILDRMLFSTRAHEPIDRVAFAIDDRPSVIRMWRENNIKCYDVGNGDEF